MAHLPPVTQFYLMNAFDRLLVEGFTKYNISEEAIRHFRALSKIPGGIKSLHNDGNYGDPLSLYLRLLCLQGENQFTLLYR
jgi:hypothetical protein